MSTERHLDTNLVLGVSNKNHENSSTNIVSQDRGVTAAATNSSYQKYNDQDNESINFQSNSHNGISIASPVIMNGPEQPPRNKQGHGGEAEHSATGPVAQDQEPSQNQNMIHQQASAPVGNTLQHPENSNTAAASNHSSSVLMSVLQDPSGDALLNDRRGSTIGQFSEGA